MCCASFTVGIVSKVTCLFLAVFCPAEKGRLSYSSWLCQTHLAVGTYLYGSRQKHVQDNHAAWLHMPDACKTCQNQIISITGCGWLPVLDLASSLHRVHVLQVFMHAHMPSRLDGFAGLVGLGWASLLAAINIMETITVNQYFHILFRIVIQVKVGALNCMCMQFLTTLHEAWARLYMCK